MLRSIDHIYLSVSDFARSEAFYDAVMRELGQHKGDKMIGGDPHAHYLGPQFQVTIRPARTRQAHDPKAPGLHHLCFQVETTTDVDRCFHKLTALGVEVSEPRLYPEYHPEYYAVFFKDPDGIELEIVARTSTRRALESRWTELEEFLNPLQALLERESRNTQQIAPARAQRQQAE